MVTITTITLRQIMAAGPCYDPRERGLLPHDHDLDAPIALRQIIETVELSDAVWCLRATPELTAIACRFAIDCAERVRHLMTDPRSTDALDMAKRYLAGDASYEDLAAARSAAVASNAAKAAASNATWAASNATWAATAAATAAAWAVANDTEHEWQTEHLIELVEGDIR